MRIKIKFISSFVILFFSFSLLTYAQVKLKGEISGRVVDENGEILPSVTATLTGEKLFQKSLSFVSTEKGLFRFYNLNPGNYELDFALQGFNPLKISNVRVRVGMATPIRATLTLVRIKEGIEVIGQAPLIETKTTQISTNFTSETIDRIPTPREFKDLIDATPGLADSGSAYGAGGLRDKDSVALTSSYRLNGVDVSNPDIGDTWVKPNYDTIEEVQVVGIGASAEYGNFMGAMINVITKSGSNSFHGRLSLYYSDSRLYGDNTKGIEDFTHEDIKYDSEVTASISGPIIKEKLFFYLAGGYTGKKSTVYLSPIDSLTKQPHFQIKLNWLPNKNNTLSLMVNTDPLSQDNLLLGIGCGPETAYFKKFRTNTIFGSWQLILSDRMFLELKYAGFQGRNQIDPLNPDRSAYYDQITTLRYNAYPQIMDYERFRNEGYASLTYYADNLLGTSHEFKVGLEYERSSSEDNLVYSGGASFGGMQVGNSTLIKGYEDFLRLTKTGVERMGAYLQDNIVMGKATLNLGLRYDHPRLLGGDGSEYIRLTNISPRLGFSYDLGGDAKNVLHIHYGRYHEKMTAYGWSLGVVADLSYRLYRALIPGKFEPTPENIANLPNILFKPENIFREMIGQQPMITNDPEAKSTAYSDVFNLGFEKQLGKDFVLSIDYTYRRDRNFIMVNDRTQHTYEQVKWTDEWLGHTITIWNQTDRLPNDWYYSNAKWAKRRHHILMIVLRKQEIGKWSIMSSFTYQNSRGNIDNTDATALGLLSWGLDTDPYYTQNPFMWGTLYWDRPYQFKLLGSYRLPLGLFISGDFRLLSGHAWTPAISINDLPKNLMYRNGSHRIFLEERGSRRTEAWWQFNLRLAKSLRLGDFSNIEFMVDIFNLFNRQNGWYSSQTGRPYTVYALSGESSFGKPRNIRSPFYVRLGIRWSF